MSNFQTGLRPSRVEPHAPKDRGWNAHFDVIVLGAGAGGMTAALVAATKGLKPLLLEKSDTVGGTTAYSSGTTWIPDNPHMRQLGMDDDAQEAMRYLDALVGERGDRPLRQAFVAEGPKMIQYLEDQSEVRFKAYPEMPDYRQDIHGAGKGGRPLEPLAFDGRLLGKDFNRLRPPIPELTVFGGMMLTRTEASLLLRGVKSLNAIRLGIQLLFRHCRDRLHYERGTRLVLGNALVARLYKSLKDKEVDIWFRAGTQRLVLDSGKVVGIEVMHNGEFKLIKARHGVILAGGGFAADHDMRTMHLPSPVAQYTPACPDSTGDTMKLALEAGARMGKGSEGNALWFPSSVALRKDGSTAVYPHIVLDRPKPGLIAVNSAARRFANEAVSYHEFTRAMYSSQRHVPTIPAFLLCDRRFLWKYGLGMIRPHTLSIRAHIENGYLIKASTLEELAGKLQLDCATLTETVERYNGFARTGIDADFNKGGTLYERANGDAQHQPNPCLGELKTAPYFAVKVYPTPLGTSLGLAINTHAQVLGQNGQPIPGLYACGNDADSIFAGEYPGAGAQIGPAMTFGYIAATHAGGR